MNKTDKITNALEMFSTVESIKQIGASTIELSFICDRIKLAIDELENQNTLMGLYEVSCHEFKEPIEGHASPELQAEIDIHNDHTGDNKHKSDYLVCVLEE